ncbi:hypothetical protein VTK26DRAFT_4275 [Humicola hyalothermophila]
MLTRASRILLLTTSLPLVLTSPTRSQPQCGRGLPPSPFHSSPPLPTCISHPPPTDPRVWSPWTHPPYCVESSASPYCLFTTASLPRPHGLSVITTPDEASELGALHPLSHPLDAPFFRPEKLVQVAAAADGAEGRPPYEVRDVPGKGKGAIATRRIDKGMALLMDRAAVLAAVEYPADVLREEVRELLARAVEQLAVEGRVKVEGLGGKGGRMFGGEGKGEGEGEEEEERDGGRSRWEDVMLVNSFGVKIGGKDYMALFADLARFNHACQPK